MAINRHQKLKEVSNWKEEGSGLLQEDLMCSDLLKIALSLQDRADLLGQLLRATTFPSQGQPSTLTHFSAITSLPTKHEFLLGVLVS